MTSEQILAQIMGQMNQQNKWNSPSNLINLATLGLNGVAGLAGGAQQGRQAKLSAEELAYQRAQQDYLRRMAGRTGLQSAIMGQLDRRDAAGVNIANASPLGAEQLFRQRNAAARANSAMAERFTPARPAAGSQINSYVGTNPDILSGFTTPDYRSTISSDATESSIMDRRSVIDGLRADRPDALERENQLMALLTAQMEEASKPLYQPTAGAGQPQATEKKRGGFWRTLGKIGLMAAPIVAAPFTGGASLAAIGALSGAGLGALDGGGLKGALVGAGTGALTSGFGGGAAGAGAKRVAGESVKSAVQRAVLNPRALTSLAGGALSEMDGRAGQIGQVAQAASMFLPGARRPGGGALPGFEGPNLANHGVLPGGQNVAGSLMPDLPQFAPDLFSKPNGGMGGFPTTPSMNRAGVSRPSVPGRSSRPPIQTQAPTPVSAPRHTGMGANRPTAMRAPTAIERARDMASPVFDFLGSIGMPGANQVSTTVPWSDSPYAQDQPSAFGQVSQSPIGAAILGSMAGAGGGGASLARPGQGLLPGSSGQRQLGTNIVEGQVVNSNPILGLSGSSGRPGLPGMSGRPGLPRGQYNMPQSTQPASGPFLQPGGFNLPPSSYETEIQHAPAMAQQLMAAAQAKLKAGDIQGAQALWNQLLPLLQFLPK